MKRPIRSIILILAVIAAGFLIAQFFNENAEPTRLEFMGWRTKEVPKGVLVAIAFALGSLVLGFASLSAVVAKSLEASRLRRENLALQRLIEQSKSSSASSSADVKS